MKRAAMVGAVALASVLVLGSALSEATADSLAFSVRSEYRYKAQVKFYSQTRKGHQWPDAGHSWDLWDYKTHTFNLGCITGEKICFGAWDSANDRRYWGTGHGDIDGCAHCCAICGAGDPPVQVLNDAD